MPKTGTDEDGPLVRVLKADRFIAPLSARDLHRRRVLMTLDSYLSSGHRVRVGRSALQLQLPLPLEASSDDG